MDAKNQKSRLLQKTKARAFRGRVSNTSLTLSPHQLRQLAEIDIYADPDTSYAYGLVSLTIRDRHGPRTPDINKLYHHIKTKLASPSSGDAALTTRLIASLEASAHKMASTSEDIQSLVAESNDIQAQIGLLFLPDELLKVVEFPTLLLDRVAPAVGTYVIIRISHDINTCF